MFLVRLEAYPRVEHLKGNSLGFTLSLPTNIKLDWKGFSDTHSLSYYNNNKSLAKKVVLYWHLDEGDSTTRSEKWENWKLVSIYKKLFFFVNDVSAKIS
jgi:hypothetical protein